MGGSPRNQLGKRAFHIGASTNSGDPPLAITPAPQPSPSYSKRPYILKENLLGDPLRVAMEGNDGRAQIRNHLLSSLTFVSSKATSIFGSAKVHAAAAFVQILYAGFQVLASAALSNGASRTVFPVYRNAIALMLIGPLAFFLERSTRPTLNFKKFTQFFVSGIIGVCFNQILFLSGLYYTSATFAATVQNLTPALTFLIAALLGIERMQITKREDQAKALGVLIGVGGATLIALYKGPSLLATVNGSLWQSSTLAEDELMMDMSSYRSTKLGVLCLLGNCVTWAIWFILQNPVMREYPAPLSATAFIYATGTVQLAVIALCVEGGSTVWVATFLSDLPAILYGGFVASGVAMTLQGWCAYKGGPVLVAAYQPLQTILVAILSWLLLQETFYLGSLIGGFLIIAGLYLVVWGKSRERRLDNLAEGRPAYIADQQQGSLYLRDIEGELTEPLLA